MTGGADPALSCAEAKAFEAALFGADEARERAAMEQAGTAVARAILRDFEEIGGFPERARIVVLVGRGHNGGDALIAARHLLETKPECEADVFFAFGERAVRPLALQAWLTLAERGRGRVYRRASPEGAYDLAIDGVFGFQFRPPIPAAAKRLIDEVNDSPVRLRAAIDLPSGLGDGIGAGPGVFRADFTYATGCVKRPVLEEANAGVVGRVRYLDLGFFRRSKAVSDLWVLTPRALDPIRGLRPPGSNKRTFGHLVLVGGSRSYPGAVLMAALAALKSGVGLVTVGVPRSLAPAFAARAPEAMWVGLPETAEGGLARDAGKVLAPILERANALALGPGLAREPETLELARDLVAASTVPLVIDADALQPEIVAAGGPPRILTPHAGEEKRLRAAPGGPEALARALVVRKGRLTAVAENGVDRFVSPFGGPVLARGGSGDLLTGLIGGLLAQGPDDPLGAACRGVVWHGSAADSLARSRGQTAVAVTELLLYLPHVLREG